MKNSKKGVSLIVLVITIIVIIIIAAAVILGLNNNNPINSSKISSAAQLKDSVASTVNMYLSKEIARTQGVYTATEITLGGDERESIKLPTAVLDKAVKKTVSGVDYYKVKPTEFKAQTELDLAKSSIASGGSWYVSPTSSEVIYVLDAAEYPGWMMTDGNAAATTTNLDKSLTFVQITSAT